MTRTCPVCLNRTKVPSGFLKSARCEHCDSELQLTSPLQAPHFLVLAILWLLPWLRDVEVVKAGAVCCTKCGYNLDGNTSGICPECGLAISKRYSRPDFR